MVQRLEVARFGVCHHPFVHQGVCRERRLRRACPWTVDQRTSEPSIRRSECSFSTHSRNSAVSAAQPSSEPLHLDFESQIGVIGRVEPVGIHLNTFTVGEPRGDVATVGGLPASELERIELLDID